MTNDPKDLQERLDEDESLTDQERRDIYFSEIQEQEDRDYWGNR